MRETAARIVEGLSGGQEGIDKLAPAAASLLPELLRLAPAESGASGPALTALVNLSQVSMLCKPKAYSTEAASVPSCRATEQCITQTMSFRT